MPSTSHLFFRFSLKLLLFSFELSTFFLDIFHFLFLFATQQGAWQLLRLCTILFLSSITSTTSSSSSSLWPSLCTVVSCRALDTALQLHGGTVVSDLWLLCL